MGVGGWSWGRESDTVFLLWLSPTLHCLLLLCGWEGSAWIREPCGCPIGLRTPSLASFPPVLSIATRCPGHLLPSCFKHLGPNAIQVLLRNLSWGFFTSGLQDDSEGGFFVVVLFLMMEHGGPWVVQSVGLLTSARVMNLGCWDHALD